MFSVLEAVCACVLISPYEDPSPTGLGSMLMTSFYLNHLFKDLRSKHSHILRHGELGLQHTSLERDTSPLHCLNRSIVDPQGTFDLITSQVEFSEKQTLERWRVVCRSLWGCSQGYVQGVEEAGLGRGRAGLLCSKIKAPANHTDPLKLGWSFRVAWN